MPTDAHLLVNALLAQGKVVQDQEPAIHDGMTDDDIMYVYYLRLRRSPAEDQQVARWGGEVIDCNNMLPSLDPEKALHFYFRYSDEYCRPRAQKRKLQSSPESGLFYLLDYLTGLGLLSPAPDDTARAANIRAVERNITGVDADNITVKVYDVLTGPNSKVLGDQLVAGEVA